jgi:hypothetical protein
MRILVLDEGLTMNCAFFRDTPEHEIHRFDCGPEANVDGKFRFRWSEVRRKIRQGQFDLAVVTDRKHCFWRPERGVLSGLARLAKAALWEPQRVAHLLVPRELHRAGIPWALMERNDQCLIREGNHLLYHLATKVFVRELLQNRYEIFQAYRRGEHDLRLWPKACRAGTKVPIDISKILPISLGLKPESRLEPFLAEKKQHDIIWGGSLDFRTPRMAAVDELAEASAKHGWRFFRPQKLTPAEFWQECSRSWLCLSPSGNGWDCYRHYEILTSGSVPLINYPWIERYAPLQDKKHCFFFSVERGHLTEVIAQALSVKEKLGQMTKEGQTWVWSHHRQEALRNYVIHETLRAHPYSRFFPSKGYL